MRDIIDSCVTLRQVNAEKNERWREGMSDTLFALEFQTVKIDLGRCTGKTSWA